ncbi:MAG: UdgX family uracil-DNA binding protein [Methylovirgula sp.]
MPRISAAVKSLAELARAAAACERCSLYQAAAQTVFGEGSPSAALMLVGEQPGDQEDRQGHPFVGPAGVMLDRVLQEAGLDRDSVYITNAVKHFKFEPRGKRRLHKRPNHYEVQQCRWWLEREIEIVKPSLIVALGATAAHALSGRTITLSRERGRVMPLFNEMQGMVTMHPSAILRMREEDARHSAFESLVADFRKARDFVERL